MELFPNTLLLTTCIAGVVSFDDLHPAVFWLLTIPLIYIATFFVLLIRYRGLNALYRNGNESSSTSQSPYSKREFVLDQYERFVKHREKLKKITELKGHIDARERRHEYVLRNLIDAKQFDHAEAYLSAMIAFMREIGDTDGEITYITYLDRMRQFEAAALTDILGSNNSKEAHND